MDIIQPKKIEEVFKGETNPSNPPSVVDINMIPLKGFFDLSNPTYKEMDQLKFIYKYYDNQGTQEMSTMLRDLSLLRTQLGTAPVGISGLTHIYNYLKVLSEINQLEGIKQGMIR